MMSSRSNTNSLSLWCACLLLAASLGSATADTLIDSFERAAPAPWQFGNGAEFPGATGSLSIGAGHSGQGAHLAYNFSQGGAYVKASLTLPTPLTTPAISFWVKSPPNITVSLRVVDASGQTLQYTLFRPLENLDPNAWYQQVVALNTPNMWWSGLNDGVVHFPISSLSILAGDPPLPGAVGAIDFDDVIAVNSTVFNLDPATQTLIPSPPGSAAMLPRLGVAVHFTSDNQALDAARAAGFSWVRTDMFWDGIETTPNVYNWAAYDGLVNALQTRGMKAVLILDYGNPLYTDPGNSHSPPTNAAAIQAFGNFAQAAASHFAGSGTCFEVWNEPDISLFWPPAPSTAQYAALAKEGIRRVHMGDPAARVITGGLAWFDFSFADSYLGLGGGAGADGVGIHPYDANPPEKLSDRLIMLRDIVSQHLSNAPPVWDTEWGFSSASYGDGHSAGARKRQAVMVAREFLCAAATGLPLVTYYDLRDDGTDPNEKEQNFGLLANDYSDKPAMRAVKTIASIAGDRRFSGFISGATSGLRILRFDGRTNLVVALWSSTANGQYTVTVPTNVTAMNYLGSPLTLLDWTNRLAYTVYETNGPVYFSFPGTWQATNLAPVLAAISNRTIIAGTTLTITNSFSNTNALFPPVIYSLLPSPAPPAGAIIDPASGIFSWRPTMAQASSTNLLAVIVSDSGSPSLSATQTFTVTVVPPARPVFTSLVFTNGVFRSWVTGDVGPDYTFSASTNLLDWTPVFTLSSPVTPFLFVPPPSGKGWEFYQVQLGP